MKASSSSSKLKAAYNNRCVTDRISTLHQRLQHALSLGLEYYDGKEKKWNFTDFDRQRLVVRSIDAFLDCLSFETLKHPPVKDSIPDMIGALGSILGSKSQETLILASKVAVKIVRVLPSSMLESHFHDLLSPLSSLLSFPKPQVSVSSATALNHILSNLTDKREREVSEILKPRNIVGDIVQNIKGFSIGNRPIELFQEMASLLSKILQRWPLLRFCVYTDNEFLKVLDTLTTSPEISIKASLLKIYSAIALCHHGAKKILENGEAILNMMVDSMDISKPYSTQMEAFKLAQCLMMSEEECSTVIKICGEPIVKAIITGMGNLNSGQNTKDKMSRLEVVSQLALITRWSGEHQHYFWKEGIDGVLLNLLIDNSSEDHRCLNSLPQKEKNLKIQEHLHNNFYLPLRPYIWDILGYLAAYSTEDCNPVIYGHGDSFNLLALCACVAFKLSISSPLPIGRYDFSFSSAYRAVIMMIYSPWKDLAYQTRSTISKFTASNINSVLEYQLNALRTICSSNGMPSTFQIVKNLMPLACYSGLPKCRKHVIEHQGVATLSTFIRWLIRYNGMIMAPNMNNPLCGRTCCWGQNTDWEGEELLLLVGLWCLAELVGHSSSSGDHVALSESLVGPDEAQSIEELKQIFYRNSSRGARWCAAYILGHLGFYGFPNKFGQRIQKELNEDQYSDLQLILASQESVYVHGVILLVRCPSLLPSKELKEKAPFGSVSEQNVQTHERSNKKIWLSAKVFHQTLAKLLEYLYSGCFQAGEDLVKWLKIYAKHCNLRPLLHMLHKRTPKMGDPLPTYDLSCALGSAGYHFSDIILEARDTNLESWSCDFCSSSAPHYHLHKVILSSSCDYLRALFRSGMQESYLQTLKAPMKWESLVKLVHWFYSGELPRPVSGCLWNNMDVEEKLQEVEPYVDLYWVTEYWLIGDLHEDCFSVIKSCLESCPELSFKVIQMAAFYSQWKLVEVATMYAAPLYHLVRWCGELDWMDEDLVETIRAASVRLY